MIPIDGGGHRKKQKPNPADAGVALLWRRCRIVNHHTDVDCWPSIAKAEYSSAISEAAEWRGAWYPRRRCAHVRHQRFRARLPIPGVGPLNYRPGRCAILQVRGDQAAPRHRH